MTRVGARTWIARCAGLVALALLVVGAPAPAVAQAPLTGHVLRAGGTPLYPTRVEVWGPGVVLYVTGTDADGAFTVPDLGERVERYVFRYVGFGVTIVQAEDFADGMTVVMAREPIYTLEGIAGTVSREMCPQVEDPEARDLWIAASARYNKNTSRRGLGGYYEGEMRDVDERRLFADLDPSADSDFALWDGWTAGQRVGRTGVPDLDDAIRGYGYAWPRRLDAPEYRIGRDRHLNWLYAELDTRAASHFASETFASLHTFALGPESSDGVRVNFCPVTRDGRRPSVQGAILIGRDQRLIEAEWRFRTGDPDEEAGGWVEFGTVRDPLGGMPHLVARRGVFYRHNGFEKPFPDMPRWYFRDLRAWSAWTISPGAGKPSSAAATAIGSSR